MLSSRSIVVSSLSFEHIEASHEPASIQLGLQEVKRGDGSGDDSGQDQPDSRYFKHITSTNILDIRRGTKRGT